MLAWGVPKMIKRLLYAQILGVLVCLFFLVLDMHTIGSVFQMVSPDDKPEVLFQGQMLNRIVMVFLCASVIVDRILTLYFFTRKLKARSDTRSVRRKWDEDTQRYVNDGGKLNG